jgi:LPS export ABC transporter protein LptC
MIARVLLAAALIALIAVLVQWRVVGREPAPEPVQAERPGYYLTGVDLEEFGADGRLRIGLRSISAREDPATGVVRLAEVAVDYHAPNGRRWELTAAEARVPPGGRVVDFEGDVRLSGAPEGTDTATITTPRMSLDTISETAQSNAAVQLAFGPHHIDAQGMRADLKAGRLRLDANVNGHFAR